jgi:leishmanolysin-like peptidase
MYHPTQIFFLRNLTQIQTDTTLLTPSKINLRELDTKPQLNFLKRYPGINADFILYISSISTEHCNISNTVAFASYCQLESKYNRPVAGYVNICPQSVSSKQSDIHSALATLKHEILHALGFSAGLYAFFLDSNGSPLTPRDPKSGKPPFSSK